MATIDSGLQVPNSSLPEHYQVSGAQKEVVSSDQQAIAPNEHFKNSPEPSNKKQRFCGFNPFIFVLVVAVMTAVVVGAAVGGGLGSKLSSCQKLISHL